MELPDAAWEDAEATWQAGEKWSVIVQLWTAEGGRSDLVLRAIVTDTRADPSVEVQLVYVP